MNRIENALCEVKEIGLKLLAIGIIPWLIALFCIVSYKNELYLFNNSTANHNTWKEKNGGGNVYVCVRERGREK